MFLEVIISIIILFVSIIIHECAHAWTAYRLGDPTAKALGRLTLNPLKHIDPVGTILLPGILIVFRMMGLETFVFGWAKPVPIDFTKLRHPRRDIMLVGMAGPVVNITIALLASLMLHQLAALGTHPFILQLLIFAVFVNLLLAIFNLMPIPPLDGSRLILSLLPSRLATIYGRLENYGVLIIIVLLYFDFSERVVLPIVEACGNILGVSFI